MSIIAAIEEIKKQLAVLEGLVGTAESVNESTVVTGEIPVVNPETGEILPSDEYLPDGRELLPPPPAEIIIPDMLEEDDSPTDEDKADSLLGWQILSVLPDFYHGKAARVELQKPYFDNNKDKLYIDKYRINIRVYDSKNKLLGETKKPFNTLSKFHIELIKRGIATEEELCLVTDIVGYTKQAMYDVLYARTGYRNFEQMDSEV